MSWSANHWQGCTSPCLAHATDAHAGRSFTSLRVVFGHKEVCAHLLYCPDEPPAPEETSWKIVNLSSQGMCLASPQCRAGLVQVGELISVTELHKPLRGPDERDSSKINALLGVVRWVNARGTEGICMGVEYLATSVLPVSVTRDTLFNRDTSDSLYPLDDDEPESIGENALIIACKVQRTVMQTILMPSYLYQSGDRLTASQGERSRQVQLRKCLQANGLFSQFSLTDGK